VSWPCSVWLRRTRCSPGDDRRAALLDRGGYTRYAFRTTTRLRELGAVLEKRYGGRVSALLEGARGYDDLVARLDGLPG
jgi:hypothetical protein